MILISPILDSYYKQKLKSASFRRIIFEKAVKMELRASKLGRIILRNMHEEMVKNPALHEEFSLLIGKDKYQKIFWESDLGFFWLNGNYKGINPTFNLVLDSINANNYSSHLDVGCGWGELSFLVAQKTKANRMLGIDISENLIAKAKTMHKHDKVEYLCKDILQIEEQFDCISVIGPSDYIKPEEFPFVLKKMLSLAKREIFLHNSLRAEPWESVLNLKTAKEIRRYDVGYVQPLNYLLSQLQSEYSFSYELHKHGTDSLLAKISMLDNKRS